MSENNIVVTSFKIDKALLKKVRHQAVEEETNTSEIIRRAISYYLRHMENQTTLEINEK